MSLLWDCAGRVSCRGAFSHVHFFRCSACCPNCCGDCGGRGGYEDLEKTAKAAMTALAGRWSLLCINHNLGTPFYITRFRRKFWFISAQFLHKAAPECWKRHLAGEIGCLPDQRRLIEVIRQYDSCNTGELDRHAQHQQPCLASRTLRVTVQQEQPVLSGTHWSSLARRQMSVVLCLRRFPMKIENCHIRHQRPPKVHQRTPR